MSPPQANNKQHKNKHIHNKRISLTDVSNVCNSFLQDSVYKRSQKKVQIINNNFLASYHCPLHALQTRLKITHPITIGEIMIITIPVCNYSPQLCTHTMMTSLCCVSLCCVYTSHEVTDSDCFSDCVGESFLEAEPDVTTNSL